jgi:3-dehydroquinate synthase
MAVSPASDSIDIQSHRGPYRVVFEEGEPFASLRDEDLGRAVVVLDARVGGLYARELAPLDGAGVLRIEADEAAKSLDRFPEYVERLVAHRVRRGHVLLAIGGGVIQDIVCFLAAVLLRGLEWRFYPTTLLAQADSCIGSKSSINVGRIKNVLGTFTPPAAIRINTRVLATLDPVEIRSGIGEMLKVHAIDGSAAFDRIAADYGPLLTDRNVLERYIRASLLIKQRLIEADEFDVGARRVMNYGHSFGHAIESATDFSIPHGIAVTIGMDMANYVAARLGVAPAAHFERMHPALAANYAGFDRMDVPLDALLEALGKDKKNTDSSLTLILPDAQGTPAIGTYRHDAAFRAVCADYFASVRHA